MKNKLYFPEKETLTLHLKRKNKEGFYSIFQKSNGRKGKDKSTWMILEPKASALPNSAALSFKQNSHPKHSQPEPETELTPLHFLFYFLALKILGLLVNVLKHKASNF